MPTEIIYASLHIRDLELKVNLGWRNQEREQDQGILIDLIIQFPIPPKACATDHLEDTICYAELTDTIRDQINNKHYKLIEHLTAEIYTIVKMHLPNNSKLTIALTKYPIINGLKGGVCFRYGDSE